MLKRFIIAVAIACLTTTAYAKPPHVVYDRFKQRTELSVQEDSPTSGGGIQRDSVWLQAVVKEGKINSLQFAFWHGSGAGWKYLQCSNLNFLVDGKPFEGGKVDFQKNLDRGITLEMLYIDLTRQQLAQWAAASKIEFEVCHDEKVFSDQFMQDIRDFGTALDEQIGVTPQGKLEPQPGG